MGLRSDFMNEFSEGRPVTGHETTATLAAEVAAAVGGAAVLADVLEVSVSRARRLVAGKVNATDTERAALVAAVRRLRLPADIADRRPEFSGVDHHGKQTVIRWDACEMAPGTWEAMTRLYLESADIDPVVTLFVRSIGNEWYSRVFRQTWRAERRGEVS